MRFCNFCKCFSSKFLTFFALFGTHWGDTIDVNERLIAGIADVMRHLRGNIGNFTLSDLVAVVFTDKQLAAAGKENQQFLTVFCAMPAAGLAGR